MRVGTVDYDKLEAATVMLLDAIGEDSGRDGLKDMPARVARHWRDFIEYDPGNIDTSFQAFTTDQVVGGLTNVSYVATPRVNKAPNRALINNSHSCNSSP